MRPSMRWVPYWNRRTNPYLLFLEDCLRQTQKEDLAVNWCVKRLHKFLYGLNFKLVTDHEALRYIYNPEKSLSRCTSSMLTRWAVALSAYSYKVEYKPGTQIPQADFMSRQSYFDNAPTKIQTHFDTSSPRPKYHHRGNSSFLWTNSCCAKIRLVSNS